MDTYTNTISLYVNYETLNNKHSNNTLVPTTDIGKVKIFRGKFLLVFKIT